MNKKSEKIVIRNIKNIDYKENNKDKKFLNDNTPSNNEILNINNLILSSDTDLNLNKEESDIKDNKDIKEDNKDIAVKADNTDNIQIHMKNTHYQDSKFKKNSNLSSKITSNNNPVAIVILEKQPSATSISKVSNDFPILSYYENKEIFYQLIASPLQKGNLMSCELHREKLKDKTIWRMFLSDGSSDFGKLILYAVSHSIGKYYIGLGSTFNDKLGTKLNTILTFQKNKNKIVNKINNDYLAKITGNLLKKKFSVFLREKNYVSKDSNSKENNDNSNDKKEIKAVEIVGNEFIDSCYINSKRSIDSSQSDKSSNTFSNDNNVSIIEGDKLNICTIRYFSQIEEHKKLNVIIPKPLFDQNDKFERFLNSNKEEDLWNIYKNNLTLAVDKLLCFVNKTPNYSENLKCLVLNFGNRNVVKSKQNFQLVEMGQSTVLFQFGKVASNKYILDFKYPFSPLQAFSIAVTATLK